jgi:hypothetical protein
MEGEAVRSQGWEGPLPLLWYLGHQWQAGGSPAQAWPAWQMHSHGCWGPNSGSSHLPGKNQLLPHPVFQVQNRTFASQCCLHPTHWIFFPYGCLSVSFLRTVARDFLQKFPHRPPTGLDFSSPQTDPFLVSKDQLELEGEEKELADFFPQASWEILFKFRPYPPRMKISYFYVSKYLLLN